MKERDPRSAVEAAELRVQLDSASTLPSLASVLHDVRVLLQTYGYVGIILIDLEPLAEIEAECGSEIYNGFISTVCKEVMQLRSQIIRAGDLLCSVRPFGEQMALFLEGSRKSAVPSTSALESAADRVWAVLSPKVAELVRPYGSHANIRLGYALMLPNPMIQGERLIYRAIDKARIMAHDYSRLVSIRSREKLRDVIVNRLLTSVFQPILNIDGCEVQAYEALIRGPSNSDLSSPAMLFKLAAHADVSAELDRACCETTLSYAKDLPPGKLLFANTLPALLNDPGFRAMMIEHTSAVDPSRIVLEINEGVAIRSYEVLSRAIEELRTHGIRVAVDDLGAGYANLDHILRLKPDFLKLDISLIRGIDQSQVKRALVKSMVSVGKAVGSTVIAEGIEEIAERNTLLDLGVEWGQGYLFARPGPGFVDPGIDSAIFKV